MEFQIKVQDHTYKLVGGGMCPEQYDVHNEEGELIAYYRLRHGVFTAEYLKNNECFFTSYPYGDGFFEEPERLSTLTKATQTLHYYHAGIKVSPTDAQLIFLKARTVLAEQSDVIEAARKFTSDVNYGFPEANEFGRALAALADALEGGEV